MIAILPLLGLATESETSQAFSIENIRLLNTALETNSALNLAIPQTVVLGLASESDSSLPLASTITLTDLGNNRIFQRNGTSSTITVSGTAKPKFYIT